MKFSKILLSLILTAFLTSQVFALKAWVPFKYDATYLFNMETQQSVKIMDEAVERFTWSPDGKKIGFVKDTSFWVMNNNGSDPHKMISLDTIGYKEGLIFNWTTKGIIYKSIGKIYLYDTSSQNTTELFNTDGWQSSSKTGPDGGPVLASKNGQVLFFHWRNWSDAGTWFNPVIWLDSDLKNPVQKWVHMWYHGDRLLPDGSGLAGSTFGATSAAGYTPECGNHAAFSISSLDTNNFTPDTDVPNGFQTIAIDSNCNDLQPPDGEGPFNDMGGVRGCANNSDYYAFTTGGDITLTDKVHAYIINWKTDQLTEIGFSDIIPTDTKKCGGDCYQTGYDAIGEFWIGDLPSAVGPAMNVSAKDVVFTIDNGGTTQNQTIAITNAGTQTLPEISADASDDATSWLSATVSGGASNSQTVMITANPASVSVGTVTGTVTLTGSGIPSASIHVTLTYGSSVSAPSGLTSEVASNGSTVTLAWMDNADNETGFSIERSIDGGSFNEIGTVGANTRSYTDDPAPAGDLTYRILTLKDSKKSVPSNESSITVSGVASFVVTNPKEGDTFSPGATITVNWTAPSDVTQVMVKASFDGGLTWIEIHPDGGVAPADSIWGKMPWTIPDDATTDKALVQVHEYEDASNQATSGKFSIGNTAVLSDQNQRNSEKFSVTSLSGRTVLFHVPSSARGNNALTVFTASGAQVLSSTNVVTGVLAWDASSLPSGSYIVRFTGAGKNCVSAIAIMK